MAGGDHVLAGTCIKNWPEVPMMLSVAWLATWQMDPLVESMMC